MTQPTPQVLRALREWRPASGDTFRRLRRDQEPKRLITVDYTPDHIDCGIARFDESAVDLCESFRV